MALIWILQYTLCLLVTVLIVMVTEPYVDRLVIWLGNRSWWPAFLKNADAKRNKKE